MSYGHADKIAGAGKPEPTTKAAQPIDPALYRRDDMRKVLAGWDIAALYREVGKHAGLSQRQLAQRTGQSQSEVSDLVNGHRGPVVNRQVLRRISGGLDIPPEMMGLSWWGPDGTWYGPDGTYPGPGGAYPEEVMVVEPPKGVDEDVRRRAALLAAPAFLWGRPLLGDVPELPAPAWVGEALPSRLGMADVVRVEQLTEHLRALSRQYGVQASIVRAAAGESMRLLAVPAPDSVAVRLGSALAHQQALAGWCCADSLLDAHAWHHFQQALELAGKAGDGYRMANILRCAGDADLGRGHPNDALKLYQLALVKLAELTGDDPRIAPLAAILRAQSALALAQMRAEDGATDHARSALSAAHDGWEPPDTYARADFDSLTARVHLELGRLDTAEQFAAVSMRTFDDRSCRDAVLTGVTLATIHVRAGDPRGVQLAYSAIAAMTKLSSARARKRLKPLVTALEARPGPTARELARMARQVAATQA